MGKALCSSSVQCAVCGGGLDIGLDILLRQYLKNKEQVPISSLSIRLSQLLSTVSLESDFNTHPTNPPVTHNPRPHRPSCRSLQLCPFHPSFYLATEKQQSDFASLRSAATTRLSGLLSQYIVTLQPRSKPDFYTISGGFLPFVFPILVSSTPIAYQRPAWPMSI
jgi:hypothetical protein